jgi:hypothetical protein
MLEKMQTAKLEKGKIAMSIQCVRQAAITDSDLSTKTSDNLRIWCSVAMFLFKYFYF